jgi:hypothetical protein
MHFWLDIFTSPKGVLLLLVGGVLIGFVMQVVVLLVTPFLVLSNFIGFFIGGLIMSYFYSLNF